MYSSRLRVLWTSKALRSPIWKGRAFLNCSKSNKIKCTPIASLSQKAHHNLSKRFERSSALLSSTTSWNRSTVNYNKWRPFHTTGSLYDEIKVVSTPPFAESVTEGDVKWEKEVGNFVKEDELLAEIETDKTAIPVPSPVTGVITELLVPDGEKVEAGAQLCKIKLSSEPSEAKETPAPAPSPSAEATPPPSTPTPPPPQPQATPTPIPTTPPPPPPLPGQPFVQTPPLPPPPLASPPTPSTATKMPPGTRGERRVKMTRMRQRIAQRLKEAQNVNAMLTTFNEIDMSNIIAMRNKFKDDFLKKHGVKLGFMSPFVKASCFALEDQPVVNAVIDGTEIVYRDYIDISVAVATPKGLVVPVLRNVRGMNYAEIEMGINELGVKARDGNLAVEDMDGGTFTISNGGVFGSLYGTPIINPPQSAILGMHGVFDRPVAIDKKVEVRPMMYIALTYDHRLIDGREAALFLRKIKSAVEDPHVLLLDL